MSKIDGVTYVGSDTIGVSKQQRHYCSKKTPLLHNDIIDFRCGVVALLYI